MTFSVDNVQVTNVTVTPDGSTVDVAVTMPSNALVIQVEQSAAPITVEATNETLIVQVESQGIPGRDGALPIEYPFAGQSLITVDHYRGYRPIVSLSNTVGSEIDGAVEHQSLNSFTVFLTCRSQV